MSIIFVVSSPAGGGKTTLCELELKRNPSVRRVVTHTTRKPRDGEKDGVDYHFVDREEFEAGIKKGEFVEYAIVHGHYYGTSKVELERILKSGYDAILAIDVQGARNIKRAFDNVVTIFILPPNFETWLQRMKDGKRSDIDVRLRTAIYELDSVGEFEYCIVNDRLDEALERFHAIIVSQSERMKFVGQQRIELASELKKKIMKQLEG